MVSGQKQSAALARESLVDCVEDERPATFGTELVYHGSNLLQSPLFLKSFSGILVFHSRNLLYSQTPVAARLPVTDWRVMVGPSSQEFGTKLAKRLGLPLLAVTTTEFPDGEIKYKFDEKLSGLRGPARPVDLSAGGQALHAALPSLAPHEPGGGEGPRDNPLPWLRAAGQGLPSRARS